MSFEINPKELSLQDAAGMQLANLIRKLANEVGEGGASSLAELSDVDLTNIAVGDGLMYDGQEFVRGYFIAPQVVGTGYVDVGEPLDPYMVEYMRHHEPIITISQQWAIEAEGDSVNGIAFVRPTFAGGASGRLTNLYATVITDESTDPFYYRIEYTVGEDNEITGVQLLDSSAPLHVTITPTSADMSTGTVSGATYNEIRAAVLSGRRVYASISGLASTFEITGYDSGGVSGFFAGLHPTTRVWTLIRVYIDSTGATADMFPLASS